MDMKLILPDTNVLILGFKDEVPYNSFLRKIIKEKRLALSAVVIAEYLVGVTEDQEKLFNALVTQFPVLPIDLPVAQLAAFYRRIYMKKGKKIGLPDCLIAATCKIYNTMLATLNPTDYPMKEVEIYKF